MSILTDASQQLKLTPSGNTSLAQKLGSFETLTEGLEYAARGDTGFNFYSNRGALEHVIPFRELRDRAIITGRRLIRSGLKRGDRVGLIAETGPEFVEVFFGCQYAGLVPCPMPYSMYIGGRETYVSRLVGMMRSAQVSAMIAREGVIGDVAIAAKQAGLSLVLTHDDLASVPDGGIDLIAHGKNDVAYIQYSSGSTSEPKGVLITQGGITANSRGILESGLSMKPEDRGFSWLPFYHDMGLVGFCLAAAMGQVSVDFLATTAFARRPVLWLKIMSDNKSSCCFAPTFGYELVARRINGGAKDLDLSNWRVAGIGGDMVRADVLDRFNEALKPAGFNPRAFLPSYGMAETTLAAAFAEVGEGFVVDTVDQVRSKQLNRAVPVSEADSNANIQTRSFVVCGRPIPGHEMEVRDAGGAVLSERGIGHIMLKGPSIMAGYFDNEEATSAVIRPDGWLATGDMGYMIDGRVVVTGRCKDMILHNGRNIWPQDIEWAVEKLDDVKSGDVAAFSLDDGEGEERIVVLVQCRTSCVETREALRSVAAGVVRTEAGAECEVVLISPRSLPFTSSGKLSRAGAKDLFLSGDIAEIATILPAANDFQPLQEMQRTA